MNHRASRALTAPPTSAVLTVTEVKRHLRVDFDDDDDVIADMIAVAVGQLDPAAGGQLGRALRPQQWELRLAGFTDHDCHHPRYHAGAIALPFPPLISIDSFTYDDAAGFERALVENVDFRILGVGARHKQAVVPVFGRHWPTARSAEESVRIRFMAGYPLENDALPAPIKAWLKLQIGALYENREGFSVGTREAVAELPDHIQQMITPYRVY